MRKREPGIKVSNVHVCVDIFADDDLLAKTGFEFGGITPAPQTVTCTANHHYSSIGLTLRKPHDTNKLKTKVIRYKSATVFITAERF